MTKKTINILGVTGSVGRSAVEVIMAHPDKFEVNIVTAHTSQKDLQAAARRLNARRAILTSTHYQDLLTELDRPVDITLAAIVGMAGLEPLMKAIPNSKVIAIANKEPLVAAGNLVLSECAKYNTKILPVDSEHNAIFQVFEENQRCQIKKIILTGSGGPFLNLTREEMREKTAAQAIKHPNWSMGAKISVDSATMMNKALELIEAHFLFDMPPEQIDILIHPQSVIHSMVEYSDGSVLAQLGAPDMKTPITYALGWPDRMRSPGETLDFTKMTHLDFKAPDFEQFPSLRLGYQCLKEGQAACLIFNAANEIAVEAFLKGDIGFLQIVETVEQALSQIKRADVSRLQSILDFDQNVRIFTKNTILNLEE